MDAFKVIGATIGNFIETFPGNFCDTVPREQPGKEKGEIRADLHAHPKILNKEDLYNTLDVLVRHDVDLIAITGWLPPLKGLDFYGVKSLIENKGLEQELDYYNGGSFFQIGHSIREKRAGALELTDASMPAGNNKRLIFIGAYEVSVTLEGVNGNLHMISIMPDPGFEKEAAPPMTFHDYLAQSIRYNAVIMATHPYTLWDPHGPFGIIRFRIADEQEREIIRNEIFPNVHAVDEVATNTLWMRQSNELLAHDWQGKPFCNSDAHGISKYALEEIGRSGNLLPFNDKIKYYMQGNGLRHAIMTAAKRHNFRPYTNYTPLARFAAGVISLKVLGW